jgi:Flp pilus assembly protein TadG
MLLATTRSRRPGSTLLECALVYPAVFFFVLALLVGGLGIFRYQEMACLAREAARYACVRGSGYQKDTGNASPTQSQIQTNVVQAMQVALQNTYLTTQVYWIDMNTGTVSSWDSSSKAPTTNNSSGQPIAAHVRVTVSYQWYPEVYLTGPLTLTSTCEIPMCN